MKKKSALILTGIFSPTRSLLNTIAKGLVLGLSLAICTVTTTQAGTTIVRDRNGKIIEQRTTRADGTVEVRDANGRLKETRTRHGNRILIRDASGRLIRTDVSP